MLRFVALQGGWVHENVEHSQHRENVIYRDLSRVVELFLQLETNNKSCKIMWRLNTSTCIRYILVVRVIGLPCGTLYLHRDFSDS